jgi:hypothetical protein
LETKVNHSRHGAGFSATKYFEVHVKIAAGTGDDEIDVYINDIDGDKRWEEYDACWV